MDPGKTAIERAFELARTGRFSTNDEIKQTLSKEGYVVAQITGRTLLGQLRLIMRNSRQPHEP